MHLNQSEFYEMFPKNASFGYNNRSALNADDNQTMEDFSNYEMPTEDKIILGFLALLGLLVVVTNLTVLGLAMKLKFLRAKPNYILISLAFSDFSSGAVAIPLLVACNATFEEPLCIGMDVCQRFLSISTILHLATDVMNRYFRIVKPFVYRKSVTVNKLALLIILLWTLSLTCALVQIIWIRDPHLEKQVAYNTAVFLTVVFVPFLVIILACAQMFRAIRKRKDFRGDSAKIKNIKLSERRALAVYCLMTFCFVIGWFPYFLITILDDAGFRVILPYWLNIVLLFLKYSTSLSDPLLYALMKADFQKGLRNCLVTKKEEDEPYSVQMRLYISRRTSRNTKLDESSRGLTGGEITTL